MDTLLDPRNNPVEEFFIFIKIQDGCRRSKIEFRHNFGSKITFRLGKWIPLIRFGQNLARGIIFFLSFLDPIAPESSINFCGSFKLTCQLFTRLSSDLGGVLRFMSRMKKIKLTKLAKTSKTPYSRCD